LQTLRKGIVRITEKYVSNASSEGGTIPTTRHEDRKENGFDGRKGGKQRSNLGQRISKKEGRRGHPTIRMNLSECEQLLDVKSQGSAINPSKKAKEHKSKLTA